MGLLVRLMVVLILLRRARTTVETSVAPSGQQRHSSVPDIRVRSVTRVTDVPLTFRLVKIRVVSLMTVCRPLLKLRVCA